MQRSWKKLLGSETNTTRTYPLSRRLIRRHVETGNYLLVHPLVKIDAEAIKVGISLSRWLVNRWSQADARPKARRRPYGFQDMSWFNLEFGKIKTIWWTWDVWAERFFGFENYSFVNVICWIPVGCFCNASLWTQHLGWGISQWSSSHRSSLANIKSYFGRNLQKHSNLQPDHLGISRCKMVQTVSDIVAVKVWSRSLSWVTEHVWTTCKITRKDTQEFYPLLFGSKSKGHFQQAGIMEILVGTGRIGCFHILFLYIFPVPPFCSTLNHRHRRLSRLLLKRLRPSFQAPKEAGHVMISKWPKFKSY